MTSGMGFLVTSFLGMTGERYFYYKDVKPVIPRSIGREPFDRKGRAWLFVIPIPTCWERNLLLEDFV